jgi:alpha-tubulin suppressor-like RCC1 family protein
LLTACTPISGCDGGRGWCGQCGTGNTEPVKAPTLVPGLSRVRRVACGDNHSLCVTSDGALYSFGQVTPAIKCARALSPPL